MLCSMFNVIDMNWTIHTFMTFTKLYCFLYGVPWRTINNFFPIHINYLFIDVSLSFQSASHSFSVLAPRDGVMTYLIIEVLRESNSSCGYYATVLPLHQLTIYREKGVRSPVCLRVSLVPIFYHTLTVYSLPRETVMQGPLVIGDCYLGIIRIQTITYPSSVFLLYANHGFLYTAHQPYLFLTYNSTSINWI